MLVYISNFGSPWKFEKSKDNKNNFFEGTQNPQAMQHEYLEKVSIGFVLPIIWFIQQTIYDCDQDKFQKY